MWSGLKSLVNTLPFCFEVTGHCSVCAHRVHVAKHFQITLLQVHVFSNFFAVLSRSCVVSFSPHVVHAGDTLFCPNCGKLWVSLCCLCPLPERVAVDLQNNHPAAAPAILSFRLLRELGGLPGCPRLLRYLPQRTCLLLPPPTGRSTITVARPRHAQVTSAMWQT